MIITISGVAGSGKSTIAKLLAKKLHYKHYSVGDFMREIAKERGVSLLELSKHAEKDEKLDKALDQKQIEHGKNEDNFVIDSRLGFHFIPKSKKIFLDVDLNVAAKRIFNDKREHELSKDIKESLEKIKTRIKSEERRYKEYYDLDYKDKSHYDAIIDTTELGPDEIVKQLIDLVQA